MLLLIYYYRVTLTRIDLGRAGLQLPGGVFTYAGKEHIVRTQYVFILAGISDMVVYFDRCRNTRFLSSAPLYCTGTLHPWKKMVFFSRELWF